MFKFKTMCTHIMTIDLHCNAKQSFIKTTKLTLLGKILLTLKIIYDYNKSFDWQ